MKFKTKLYVGFGSILTCMIIIAFFVMYMMQEQNKFMNEIVKERYERVNHVNTFRVETFNTAKRLRDLILLEDEKAISREIKIIEGSRLIANNAVELLKNSVTEGKSSELVIELDYLNKSYNEAFARIVQLVNEGKKEEAINLLLNDYRDVRDGLGSTYGQLIEIEEQAMKEALIQSNEMYSFTRNGFLYLIATCLVIGIGVTLWVIKTITTRIRKVNAILNSAADNNSATIPRIEIDTNDEFMDIARAYNEMAKSLEEHMAEENDLKEKMRTENWIKTNWAEITTMYQGIQDIQNFARLFISKLTPIVGASYGVFYMKNEREEKLTKIASYASVETDINVKSIRFGEGLVGQAALENQTILVDSLPDNYIHIKSGLGQGAPTHLLILPVEYEGKVIAVVEMASFKAFDPVHKQFLEIVFRTVGISLNSIMAHMKMEKLLAESQTLTEELQSQSEELQQQQEELRMINEQLEEQYKNSEEKTKELEKVKIVLEEKNQTVELSSKYKTEFLANMSHELRTPLNSMLILSQLLAENNDKNLTDNQVEYANTIHSSGKDLLYLIDDILDLSKIESGKMPIFPEEILFTDIQEFVEQQFTPIAKQKGLEYKILIDESLPYVFFTDAQRLKQILKNLLSNAFKFTSQGRVTLHFKLSTSDQSKKSMLAISVTDTGIGISKEKQQIIFEAFNQADGTTSRKYGGTGLGLSISKELAQLLGGYIEISSVEGKGSTFTLYLPEYEIQVEDQLLIAEAAATVEDQTLPVGNEGTEQLTTHGEKSSQANELKNIKELLAGRKVLLVDDDMRNIFSLTTALETNKMIVEFAENGKDAIEILNSQSDFDLVLMDIMMPIMDGYEAMKKIRQIDRFKDLPIIALTAKAMKNDREKCLEAGASDYISKPVNLEQLLSLIRVWLYRER
ncbi:response regulator [Bacillus sp. Marseille-P3661]|uniref:response regulator n=1 Tax=Bacillus sp. Marseille-P3661 TaxID=1936234 RepID=UPI000C83E6B8|nr:response regulator [Bacillus sp. Marseille-P3661]